MLMGIRKRIEKLEQTIADEGFKRQRTPELDPEDFQLSIEDDALIDRILAGGPDGKPIAPTREELERLIAIEDRYNDAVARAEAREREANRHVG